MNFMPIPGSGLWGLYSLCQTTTHLHFMSGSPSERLKVISNSSPTWRGFTEAMYIPPLLKVLA